MAELPQETTLERSYRKESAKVALIAQKIQIEKYGKLLAVKVAEVEATNIAFRNRLNDEALTDSVKKFKESLKALSRSFSKKEIDRIARLADSRESNLLDDIIQAREAGIQVSELKLENEKQDLRILQNYAAILKAAHERDELEETLGKKIDNVHALEYQLSKLVEIHNRDDKNWKMKWIVEPVSTVEATAKAKGAEDGQRNPELQFEKADCKTKEVEIGKLEAEKEAVRKTLHKSQETASSPRKRRREN